MFENKANLPDKLLKPYNPAETESRIYQAWEESGLFNPDVSVERGYTKADAETFSIVLPPPNVTGTLHTGHALMLVIQDIMVRYERMLGKKTLWIPGTDHAAIATQSKVEKLLEKEGIKKADLGREAFLKRVEAFAQQSHDTIVNQAKKMGASLDWSREAYTLDEKRSLAVRTTFKQMYDDGLIYRKYRVVNWDPKGQTVISDDEIVHEERDAVLYTFKYSPEFPIAISTTRPETKVGDTAVAVHPDDTRYKQFIGQTFTVADFCGVPLTIKVIGDESVDPEFGTGALGVTPAHSKIDWDMAQRHDVPVIPIINEFAKMTVGDDRILGKKTTDARAVIVEWLRAKNLLQNEESIKQNIGTAERTGGIIEPLPKLQWFIDVNKKIPARENKSLKELMQDAINVDGIKILPDRFEKVYFHWINNLQDWCISRQIWYGHRIPVWYCIHCQKETINFENNENIYLVRHGETDFNKNGKVQGSTNIPLNETGRAQAKEAGEKLKGIKVDYVICSDLIRAKETAEIIQSITGGTLIIDPEIKEKSYGDLEGQDKTELKLRFPDMYTYEWRPTNGESYKDAEERMHAAFEKITETYKGKNIVIVSHGAVLRTLIKRLRNIDSIEMFARPALKNAEVIHLDSGKMPCSQCGNHLFEQDSDTLDTWFSAGLWTFSTLGWPEQTNDLKQYHPTSVLETGHDILFPWVARMILMSKYLLNTIPFKTVYLHGMVRTADGKKMSKSLGEKAIDPLDIISKYGNDGLRMAMIIGNTPGNDLKLNENDIRGYSKFGNKMWNASRFVLENITDLDISKLAEYDAEDLQSINELNELIKTVTTEMNEYKFSLAGEKLYHYFWHTFADIIIERSKKKIIENNSISAKWVLYTHLTTLVKALHPFMPFITEEIWSTLRKTNTEKLLIIESWPESK
jgi:valyl-tRNA synthetase